MTVRVQYTCRHSYCDFTDRRGHAYDLSYDVCVCRGDSCTWTVHVHLLRQSNYGCSNGTVTKHGCSGHPSYIAMLFNIFKVDVKLCHKARDTYTTSAQVNNHIIIIIIVQ